MATGGLREEESGTDLLPTPTGETQAPCMKKTSQTAQSDLMSG